VFGAAAGRAVMAKKAEQARAAAPQGPVMLELAPSDLVVVHRVEVVRALSISGGLKAVNTAVVKAKVAAEVREITVREGDAVRAGQVVGHLDTVETTARLRQAQEQASSTRAQEEIAEHTLANNRALVNQGFISQNALDTSVSNAAAARANLQAANAAVDLAQKGMDDTVLRAPIAGQVSARLVQPGERVALDARILEIVDLSRIELEAPVAAEDVGSLRIGASASLKVDGIAEPVNACVVRINPSTQAGTRAVMVYFELEHHPLLRQGLFANGTVAFGRVTALAVPRSSVRVDQSRPYVLALEGDKIVRREVQLGASGLGAAGEDVVEIVAGVKDGASVLLGSIGAVRDGTAAKVTAVGRSVASAGRAPVAKQ
jgi:RND family efflux transporter MFP subunit